MNAGKIIDEIGGRKVAISLTGLTKGRISQWITENKIPDPWLKYFEAKFPELDWPHLRGEAPPRSMDERRKMRRRSTDKKT